MAVQAVQKQYSWFGKVVLDIRMLRIEEHNDLMPAIAELELDLVRLRPLSRRSPTLICSPISNSSAIMLLNGQAQTWEMTVWACFFGQTLKRLRLSRSLLRRRKATSPRCSTYL